MRLAKRPIEGETAITGAGYGLYKICRCGGILKYKFRIRNTTKEIWLMPELNKFKKIDRNVVIRQGSLTEIQAAIV